MPNVQRNFIKGRMNKSLDERLIPNGEYVDAMNVRLGSTENSDIGSVENTKGNTVLTDIEVNGQKLSEYAKCIGTFEDGANETLYWFVTDHDFPVAGSTSQKCDLILSYNVNTSLLTYHIISISKDASYTDTGLNFNSAYLITGVDLVDEMLFFTDDYNPPRKINITKSYPIPTPAGAGGIDGFSTTDILVIKAPPLDAPLVTMVSSGGEDNFLENKFICFAYRYRYEDGEYSATSPFSSLAFSSKPFSVDTADSLNAGMLNKFNLAQVQIYTGDSLVKGIDLLFKESNSTIIRVIQKLDKIKDAIADQAQWTFNFDNSKVYTVLPSSEILRLYDNVPRFAKAQSIMGNRLMYGNYVEGYNLIDENNNEVRLDFSVDLVGEEIGATTLPPAQLTTVSAIFSIDTSVVPVNQADGKLEVDLTGMPLTAGTTFALNITFSHGQFTGTPPTPTTPTTSIDFVFTLPQDYNSVNEMASSVIFQNSIGTTSNVQTVPNSCSGGTLTDIQNCVLPAALGTYTKTSSGISPLLNTISIGTILGSNVISFQLVAMGYVSPTPVTCYEYYKIDNALCSYRAVPNTESLHSDRDYEIGIVYLDEFARATTALVSMANTLHIPCINSDLKNTIKVTIPTTQLPPSWAQKYRFVCKADRENYYNIFSNFFFQDRSQGWWWLFLEGQNSFKVEKGDKLRVKVDANGALTSCVYTTVLEKNVEPAGFIDDSVATSQIPPQAGVYIKIKPENFAIIPQVNSYISVANFTEATTASQHYNDYPTAIIECNQIDPLTGLFVDYTIPDGSMVNIYVKFERLGSNVITTTGCDHYCYEFDFDLQATSDYANFEGFWTAQVEPILNSGVQCDGNATITQQQKAASTTNNAQPSSFTPVERRNFYQFWRDIGGTNALYLTITSGADSCSSVFSYKNRKSKIIIDIDVWRASQLIAFETETTEANVELYYEGNQTFHIKSGQHMSGTATGDQDQTTLLPALVNLNFSNCISFGNGVESYQIEDSVSGSTFNLGNRVTSVSIQDFVEMDRFADLTYSGVYNDESNVNKLNEFNLGLANFFPLEESFGEIQILYGRKTDLLTLQEDKISYVTVGKNILTDAVGGGTVTSVPEVLGQQVSRLDEFGISNNPESFVVYGYDKFFTDSKRGAVLRLKGSGGSSEQLTVLSQIGMRSWFRDLFITSPDTQKLGGFDPYMNEYVLSSNDIKLPAVEECIECGIIQNLTVASSSEYTFCVDLTTVTGTVNIPYTFAAGDSGTIAATYNAVTVTTGVVSGSGTLSVTKNSPAVTTVSITITPSGGAATLRLAVECPTTTILKVIQVCVTSNIDSAQFIHNEFGYVDGTYISPSNSSSVTFVAGTTNPLISQYESFNGVQGDSICPTNGSTVKLSCTRLGFDNFTFDTTTDKFRYLRSNTVYGNTPVDIAALIAASTQALPLVTTGAPNSYYAEFAMPGGTDAILYLIYDYRNTVEHGLCYDAASVVDVCCVCTYHWYLMRNAADSNEEYVAISPVALVIGTHYTLLNSGSKCFEVISISTTIPTEYINAACTP